MSEHTVIHSTDELRRKYLPLTYESEQVAKMSSVDRILWMMRNTPEHVQEIMRRVRCRNA